MEFIFNVSPDYASTVGVPAPCHAEVVDDQNAWPQDLGAYSLHTDLSSLQNNESSHHDTLTVRGMEIYWRFTPTKQDIPKTTITFIAAVFRHQESVLYHNMWLERGLSGYSGVRMQRTRA